jgi:hypothetical protein
VSDLSDDEVVRRWQAFKTPQPGERYEHYKGGEYEVVCLSLCEATGQPLVTYRSLLKGYTWTRTLANWLEEVDGQPRFRRVGRAES